MTEQSGATATGRKRRPRLIGMVTSDNVTKTRKVVFEYLARHPKYNKYVKRQTVLHVHDEKNESHVGDHVEVMQCRPISKSKTYRLVRIVTRGPQVDLSVIAGEASRMFEKQKADQAAEKSQQPKNAEAAPASGA